MTSPSYPVAERAAGYTVQAADWNQIAANVNDENTRLSVVESRTTDATIGNSALSTSKVPTTRQVIAGTGLTGGGDLTADRTISANFGTTAGTVAQGNDSRITVTQDAVKGNDALDVRVSALEGASGINHGTARYICAGSNQNISGDTKLMFPTVSRSYSGVTASGTSNQNFTLTGNASTPHVWLIEVSYRVTSESARPQVSIVPSGSGSFDTSLPIAHNSGGSFAVHVSTVTALTANTTFSIWGWVQSPGAMVSTDFGSHVTFTRLW